MGDRIFLCCFGLLLGIVVNAFEQKSLVVIIPSYNNQEWIEKNLSSVLEQEYDNYRVIFLDDCSTDKTYEYAVEIVAQYGQEDRVTLIRNDERCGALANTYTAIHACRDDEYWLVLDGDDWYPHNQVLATFNRYYNEYDAWATFGQYIDWPNGKVGHAESFPDNVIRSNTLRQYRLPSKRGFLPITAPRTGCAWLFKLIKLEDLLYYGNFYSMAADYAYMIPVLELAGFHQKFIPDILYVYNIRNPINDARVNARLQGTLARHILGMRPYQPVLHPFAVEQLAESDSAELIIFADNPERLSNVLYQVKKSVGPIAGIAVLYDDHEMTARTCEQKNPLAASCDVSKKFTTSVRGEPVEPYEHKLFRSYPSSLRSRSGLGRTEYEASFDELNLHQLKNDFANVIWIPCNLTTIKWQLLDRLETTKNNFVLLCTDRIIIDNPIAVHEGIRMLKKTHTNLFYYALAKECPSLFATSKLPAVDLAHNIYAWYCSNKRGDWQTPVMAMTLWQKDFLQSSINFMLFENVQELCDGLTTVLDETKMLGLLGKYSLAHDMSM